MDANPNFPSLAGYEIQRLIASGGSSDVYEATDLEGKTVALKVFTLASKSGKGVSAIVEREATSLRRIKGGRVAQILEVNAASTPPFIAMELVEGETLMETVENQALAGLSLQAFIEGLVAAVSDLHAAGVIHRDLKPQNVILGPEGTKIVDLGISAISENVNTSTRLNLSGTPGWISPEQAIGAKVSPATDIFNLGLLIAYASSGVHPFGQGKPDAMIYRIVNQKPDLSLVPPEYLETVQACLQKEPEERPSIRTLAHALDEGLSSSVFAQSGDATVIASNTRLWGLLGDSDDQVGGAGKPESRKSPVLQLTRRGIAFSAVAVIVLALGGLAIWNPASGPMVASVSVVSNNPAVTDSVIRVTVSGQDSERIVVGPSTTRSEMALATNWSGTSTIRIEYLPSFDQDEPLDRSLAASDFGGNLLTIGQPVGLKINLLQSQMKVEVEKPGLFWGLLPSTTEEIVVVARGNQGVYLAEQNRLFDSCQSEITSGWQNELRPITSLNSEYTKIHSASAWGKGSWIEQSRARGSMLSISDKFYEKILEADRRQPMFTESSVAPYTTDIGETANRVLLAAVDVVDAYDSYARSLSIPRYWDGLYSDFYPRETALVDSAVRGLAQAAGPLSTAITSGANDICLARHPDAKG